MSASTDNDSQPTSSTQPPRPQQPVVTGLKPLPPFKPDLYQRAWSSTPHPTLPLLATTHDRSVTVFSLSTLSSHSTLTGGHERSVRTAAWKPGLPPHKLCLVTGSFDSTSALWRWEQDVPFREPGEEEGDNANPESSGPLEIDVGANTGRRRRRQRAAEDGGGDDDSDDSDDKDGDGWEFTLVLEGQEHEVKSVAFSPLGQYLATCSRDKSVWIWEDVGGSEEEDEWETVAVLTEHDGDVKCVAWCPDVPGRAASGSGRDRYSLEVLASSSYDNTVRIWREDGDGEWVCVAVLEGHDGTVWGVQWEPDPKRTGFPRLMTWSADQTIRIWTLRDAEEEEGEGGENTGSGGGPLFRAGLGGIPNTMRRSLREDWECTAVLPKAHSRDIYSATWSADTGLIASTGSDGVIAVYAEDDTDVERTTTTTTTTTGEHDTRTHNATAEEEAEAAAALDGDVTMTDGHNDHSGHSHSHSHSHHHHHGHEQPPPPPPPSSSAAANGARPAAKRWRVVATVANGHGAYEINHITWCRRFDPGSERRGVEEMLVTTGDDGVVRPWQVLAS